MELSPERIEATQRFDQAIDGRLHFRLPRTEQPIPDDQRAAIVLVEVLRVDRVVDAVKRRRIEDTLEPTELADELRVNPELVEQVERINRAVHERRYTGESEHQRKR